MKPKTVGSIKSYVRAMSIVCIETCIENMLNINVMSLNAINLQ